MNEKLRKWLPWVMILLFVAVAYGPRWIENRAAMSFGKPLFTYPLPEGAVLISQDAGKEDEGAVMAALLLQTDMTSEELESHYAPLEIEPAREGHSVSIDAKALSESDLDVLKNAGLYVEGEHYQFIYVTSK